LVGGYADDGIGVVPGAVVKKLVGVALGEYATGEESEALGVKVGAKVTQEGPTGHTGSSKPFFPCFVLFPDLEPLALVFFRERVFLLTM
jgi:hypothetical protein